jgi:hypothetical protein
MLGDGKQNANKAGVAYLQFVNAIMDCNKRKLCSVPLWILFLPQVFIVLLWDCYLWMLHQGCLHSPQCEGFLALTVVRWAEKVPLNLNRIMPAKGVCISFFLFFRNLSAF